MSFSELGLSDEVLKAVADAGYTTPTPIQQKAIPVVLQGRDVLGCAQTGTGKTAGFTLPMIDILAGGRARARMPRSLILEPTRELAHQVAESFEKYGKYNKLNMALLIGGTSMGDQEAVLSRGVDVLIATPGRLLDLMERGKILLADVKTLVIDEADRMLDMGFIPDIERIVGRLPVLRQTLFFSATMPPEIRRLADKFLSNPKAISVDPPSSASATVAQLQVHTGNDPKTKRATLRSLLNAEEIQSALIFCNRKRDVAVLHRSLERHGFNAKALHGDMSQPARTETLDHFKKGQVHILVCSDVAARGLDIPAVSHVFNYDVPIHAEDYIHRIGRTGRAGRSGKAFTLVTPADSKFVASIKRMTKIDIPTMTAEGVEAPVEAAAEEESGESRGRRGSRRRGGEERRKSDRRGRRSEEATTVDERPPQEAAVAQAPAEVAEESRQMVEAPQAESIAAEADEAGSEQAAGKVVEMPVRERRERRSRRGQGRSQESKAGEAKAEEKRPAESRESQGRSGQRQSESRSGDRGREERRERDRHGDRRPSNVPHHPTDSFGDHTPAFLLKEPRVAAG